MHGRLPRAPKRGTIALDAVRKSLLLAFAGQEDILARKPS